MTSMLKIIIVLLNLLLVISLVGAGLFMQYSIQKNNHDLNQLYLRKEDLMNQQQKLIQLINSVNSTLQAEIKKSSSLKSELGNVVENNQNVAAQTPITPQKSVLSTPAPVVVQRTVKKTVTRAS